MKTHIRYILICLFSLSPIISGAETRTITHDFNAMFKASPKKLEVDNTNQIGTSTQDGIVYTCSGGAEFFANTTTENKIAIFLEKSGEKVETSKIQNLDSLRIVYSPYAKRAMTVSISTDGSEWHDIATRQVFSSLTTVKMPRAGDYYVRIAYSSDKVYIKQIEYFYIDLSGCPGCFIYKPE